MSFLVARAGAAARAASQDRFDVFARGETAVLVVADGAGGGGDGARAADIFVDRVRRAVLDVELDLVVPVRWMELLADTDRACASVGETTGTVVVLAAGITCGVSAGDSAAWVVSPDDVRVLTTTTPRLGSGRGRPDTFLLGELRDRLVVATDGLFHHAARDVVLRILRAERFGRVADALVEAARLPSGELGDDVSVLVAEAV